MPQYRQDLAQYHSNLGILLNEAGQACRRGGGLPPGAGHRGKLAADFPGVPPYHQDLAAIHSNLGILLTRWAGVPTRRRPTARRLAIQEQLAADFPAVTRYRIDLGGSQVNFGNLLRANQQPELALQWYARAIATLEDVLRRVDVDATASRWLRNAHRARAKRWTP